MFHMVKSLPSKANKPLQASSILTGSSVYLVLRTFNQLLHQQCLCVFVVGDLMNGEALFWWVDFDLT